MDFDIDAGLASRLLRPTSERESLPAYRTDGGYAPAPEPAAFLAAVRESGIRGRGGAAFPLATKLEAVRTWSAPGQPPVLLANGEEGEPASVKDRWLLRTRPHLVLDGMRLAAAAIGAERAIVYLSDSAAAAAVSAALDELRSAATTSVAFELVTVQPAYVAGEETAAVRAVNGGPALPMDKPPRPFQRGVADRPTLVSNVETLANLPYLLRHGPAEYRALGTAAAPGTFLATVSVVGAGPRLLELPHGTPLRTVLDRCGIEPADVTGVLVGGYFGGLLNRRVLDADLDYESIRELGSGLGCGALTVLTGDHCPVAVAAEVMHYFDGANAGQCGSCFNGTAAMSAVLAALRDGTVEPDDLARLRRWSTVLRGRGACGTLDGATALARSLFAEFPDLVADHGECAACAGSRYSAARPFDPEVPVPA